MLSQFFWSSLSRNLFWIHHPFIVFSLNLIFSLCNSFVLSLLNNLYLVVFQVPDPGFLIQKTISKILLHTNRGQYATLFCFLGWCVSQAYHQSFCACHPQTSSVSSTFMPGSSTYFLQKTQKITKPCRGGRVLQSHGSSLHCAAQNPLSYSPNCFTNLLCSHQPKAPNSLSENNTSFYLTQHLLSGLEDQWQFRTSHKHCVPVIQ